MNDATPRAIAAIDVGTNTTLLLVARRSVGSGSATSEHEILVEEAEITRLGRGIGGDGRLGQQGMESTLAALRRFAAIAREHDAAIAAIGTEALRRAPNAAAFLEPASRILGTPIEVIAGDREAALTFRAVVESFPAEIAAGRFAIVDIGGGSTEIIVSDRGRVTFRCSLPLGSVRLHERHVRTDPPTEEERRAIENDIAMTLEGLAAGAFAGSPLTGLIGVAGTVTSLAAMALQLVAYDSSRVQGATLSLAEIDNQLGRLQTATQAERECIVGLDPRRADVIFAGAVLLRAIVRRAGLGAVRVSDRGIRWGLYYERAADASS